MSFWSKLKFWKRHGSVANVDSNVGIQIQVPTVTFPIIVHNKGKGVVYIEGAPAVVIHRGETWAFCNGLFARIE